MWSRRGACEGGGGDCPHRQGNLDARDESRGSRRKGVTMPTKSFKALVREHVAHDPAFAEALFREGIDAIAGGEINVGKTILRDCIKGGRRKNEMSKFGQELIISLTQAAAYAKGRKPQGMRMTKVRISSGKAARRAPSRPRQR